jgi:hypothetical protein
MRLPTLLHIKKYHSAMANTRTADQLIQDLLDIETTQVYEHPAHPSHHMLPTIPCRIVERDITAIYYTGKTVDVEYCVNSFGYQPGDNYNYPQEIKLKPTASVKRQLEKFQGCKFESVAEFKATLFYEAIVDEPGAEVVSAAGVLDALTKINRVYQRKQEDGTWIMDSSTIIVTPAQIDYCKGILTIQKEYTQQFNGQCEVVKTSQMEDEYYEEVVLAPSAQVRTVLREAGIVGTYYWKYPKENFTNLLAPQARIDKLRALVS